MVDTENLELGVWLDCLGCSEPYCRKNTEIFRDSGLENYLFLYDSRLDRPQSVARSHLRSRHSKKIKKNEYL